MRSSRHRGVSTLALGTALAAMSGWGAEAACVLSGSGTVTRPNTGDTITCTGTDVQNIRSAGSNNVTVGLQPNANLSYAGQYATITLGDATHVTVANGANLVGSGKGAIDAGNSLNLLLQKGGTITGGVYADSNANLTIGGTINRGVDDNSLQPVSIGLSGTGNRVTLTPGYSIAGLVYGANYEASSPLGGPVPVIPSGTGRALAVVSPIDPTSVLALGGTGNGTFDVSTVGQGAQYRNFGALEKTGTSTFVLTGTSTATLPFAINGGTAQIEGDMQTFVTTVNNGAPCPEPGRRARQMSRPAASSRRVTRRTPPAC